MLYIFEACQPPPTTQSSSWAEPRGPFTDYIIKLSAPSTSGFVSFPFCQHKERNCSHLGVKVTCDWLPPEAGNALTTTWSEWESGNGTVIISLRELIRVPQKGSTVSRLIDLELSLFATRLVLKRLLLISSTSGFPFGSLTHGTAITNRWLKKS